MRYNIEVFKCDNCQKEVKGEPCEGWTFISNSKATWFRLAWEVGETRHVKDLCSYGCLVEFVSRDANGPVDAAEDMKAHEEINLQNNADYEQKRMEEANAFNSSCKTQR